MSTIIITNHTMRPLSVIFLLVSTAGAFSPSAIPQSPRWFNKSPNINNCFPSLPSSHHANKITTSFPLSSVAPSSRHVKKLKSLSLSCSTSVSPPYHHTNNKITSLSLSSSATVSEERIFTYKKRTAILMAFMTGWADLLFIKKYNFFATMMTGNSMKMALALVEGRLVDTFFFLSVITSYIIGVGTFRRAELSYKDKALNGLFAPIIVGCFMCSDYLSYIGASKFIPGILLSFAWGIVNSVGSEVCGTLIFVVTGAMTRVANMIVDGFSRTAGRKKIAKEGMLMSLSVIGGFILESPRLYCFVMRVQMFNMKSR